MQQAREAAPHDAVEVARRRGDRARRAFVCSARVGPRARVEQRERGDALGRRRTISSAT
jgi:hypothetical protein